MSKQLYKWTGKGGTAQMGTGKWPLPKNGKPGAWLSVTGEVVPCENGLHLCRESDILKWVSAELYEVEHFKSSKRIDHDDKVVVRKARLVRRVDTITDQTLRLFACDCAERVLKHTKDKRSHNAVKVSRQYALGLVGDATWDTTRAAAWDAAWDTTRAAARDAAWDAARDAARAAA